MAITPTELFILVNTNNLDKLQNLLTTENVNVKGVTGESLHEAVCWLNVDAVRLLLSWAANPDARDGNGSTPLIYAACRHQHDIAKLYDITKLLLEAGADPNVKGSKGMTAIRWAVTNPKGDFRLVRLLVQYGADPWIKNDAGSDAVNYAETVFPDLAEELKEANPKKEK